VHQAVERGVERVGIAAQCGVGELRATTGDGGGALEQLAHAGREGAIAGVDGVLGLADEVGEGMGSRCTKSLSAAAVRSASSVIAGHGASGLT
jgi:hypothetical protein